MNQLQANPVNRHLAANRGLRWWLLGGPRRQRLRDLASGYHAQVVTADGYPGLGSGPFGGGALDFNATDQSATVAYRAALETAGVSTWSCWVRPRTFPGLGSLYVANLWSNETGSTPSSAWGLGTTAASGDAARVGVRFTDIVPTATEVASTTDLVADEWTWVGVTTDGSDATFYYDGAVESTAAFTAVPRASTDAWRLGAAALAGGAAAERRFDGLVADVRYHPGVCLTARDMRLAFDDSRRRTRRALKHLAEVEAGIVVTPPAPLSVSYTTVSGSQQSQRSLIDGRLDLLAQRIYKR
jgi:hypothetical protein